MSNQHFTPVWAAEAFVQRYFPALTARDVVLDPTCGDGRFLMGLPAHVGAFGVEVDPIKAQEAASNTGRLILTGDFLEVDLPQRPTAVMGNPPFEARFIDQMLDRCYELLEYGGRAGFVLPVYYLQTASTVVRLGKRWSIAQELIPRNLFEGLSKPILFATFDKVKQCRLWGFFLHAETHALESLRPEFRKMFRGNRSRANVWRDTVQRALELCGGRASLQELYARIENDRPTDNPWWREKVRQVAGRFFCRVAPGEFALEAV